jgi:hypothetical protein
MPLISDIEPIIDYCLFENVPKEQSLMYNAFLDLFGQKYADQFTYERGPHYADRVAIPT